MARYSEPETFEERKKAVAAVLAELAKWPHHNEEDPEPTNVNSFDSVIASGITNDRIPDDVASERYDDSIDYETYAWQIFSSAFPEVILLSKQDLREWTREQKNKSNPITATDGSKGQWRAANRARILLGEWLVGETVEA